MTSSLRSLGRPGLGAQAPLLAVLGALALADAALLAAPVEMIPAIFSRNFNEGWNALHAVNVSGPEPLYPPADSLLGNNYPPLSYYLLAALGALLGDHIVAGRVVALVSLLVVTVNLGLLVARFGGSRPAAAWTGLLFLGLVAAHFRDYVAMNDPQWLAHALMTSGVVVLLRRSRRRSAVVLGATLMVAAGLVKHVLLPLPAAAAVWLALYHRRELYGWLATALAEATLACAALLAVHGRDMAVAILLQQRAFDPTALASKLGTWLVPFALPMAIALLSVILDRRDRERRLLHLYLGFSLLLLLAIAGGAGVSVNATFDFVMASAACAGLAFDPLADLLRRVGAAARAASAQALVALALSVPLLLAVAAWASQPDPTRVIARFQRPFLADVLWLRSQPGPTGCATPALCYWAGRPSTLDLFKLHQLTASGRLSGAELSARVDDWRVFQASDPEQLGPELERLLEQRFVLGRRSPVNGSLYVHR